MNSDNLDWNNIILMIGKGLSAVSISNKIKNISLKEALDDYNKLVNIKNEDITQKEKIGNKALDYLFLKHRIKTKSRKGISFLELLKNDEILNKEYVKKLINYGVNRGENLITAQYKMFQLYFGSINSFKPIIAKKIYSLFNPTTVLDFSAGWGGRCLGAMSLNINYIGFDTNINLKKSYDEMLKIYPSNSKVKIIFKDSSKVDFSKYNYDMVFTSPPYYLKNKPLENYENMPEYKDRDDFNNKFYFPVIINSFNNLKKNGVFILNIPNDMYEDTKKILGKCNKKLPLIKIDRFKYKEYIYIWFK